MSFFRFAAHHRLQPEEVSRAGGKNSGEGASGAARHVAHTVQPSHPAPEAAPGQQAEPGRAGEELRSTFQDSQLEDTVDERGAPEVAPQLQSDQQINSSVHDRLSEILFSPSIL